MLSFMRQKAGSWAIKVVLITIVIVFVFWGVGSFNEEKARQVASVNGESIELDEYNRTYNSYIENMRRQFRDALTPELIEQLNVKQQVIEGLINQKLMLQEAHKNNLRVTDQELVEAIHSVEAFKTAGAFDNNRYRAIMSQLRMTPDLFEEGQRHDLLIEKLRALIAGAVHVSEDEARQWYDYNNAEVNIDFVCFSPQTYKDTEPNESDMKAFYEENKANYKTQPKVKACYVEFPFEKYKGDIVISDSDISDYYESYPDQFVNEKTVEARHILVKVEERASAEEVEKARLKAEEALKEAREGKDFAELAKKYSDGPTKDNGGYLGTFRRGAMVKPFADVAFSMQAGEISDLVRTQFGWHVIKVEKVNEASVRSLEDATKDIREKLIEQKVHEKTFNLAEALYDAAFVKGDLNKTAADQKLEPQMTEFFSQDGRPLKMKDAQQFAKTAFSLSDAAISEVLELTDRYVVLQRLESEPEKIPDFSEIQSEVRSDIIKRKKNEMAKADAERFLGTLKAGAEIAGEAQKLKLTVAHTGFFKRNDKIPQIGQEADISQAAFELSKEKKLPDTVFQGYNGYYVIQLAERKMPSDDGFAKEKKKIEESLLNQKSSAYFKQWLEKVKANSDITIAESYQKL